MRKFSVILILVLGLCFLIPLSVNSADDTIYLDPAFVRQDLPSGTGSAFLQFTVGNQSNSEREYRIELWNDYAYRSGGELPLDPSWFFFRSSGISLPPGGRYIFHVDFNIPEAVPGAKYTGWFKVYDVPQSQFKVITVVVRVGSAIPRFDYSIKGNTVFTVPVWGPRETQTTDKISFRIANTGSSASRYWIFPRAPDTFTKGGVVYQYQPGIREWIDFRSSNFQDHPSYSLADHPDVSKAKRDGLQVNDNLQSLVVEVEAYKEQTVVVPLTVPAEAENGLYTMFLQVMDIGPEDWSDQSGMGMNEAYAIKLFFELNREGQAKSSANWADSNKLFLIGGGAILGIIGLVVVAPLVGDKLSERKEKKLRYSRR